MDLKSFKYIALASGLLISPLTQADVCDDVLNGAGKFFGGIYNSSCTEDNSSTQTNVSEDDGGTVKPSGGESIPTSGPGVNRSAAGQGHDQVVHAKPMVVPMTPGREYTVSWSGSGTRSAHTRIEPMDVPAGYKMEVDNGDGNGWREGNHVDHLDPLQDLNLPTLTTKFRLVRNMKPAGYCTPVEITEPKFRFVPSANGVVHVDSEGDGYPDAEIPKAYMIWSMGGAMENGRMVSAGYVVLDKPLYDPNGFGVETDVVSFEGVDLPSVEVVTQGANNHLRQVIAPDMIADIVDTGSNSVEVRFYSPEAKGAADGNGVYSLSGSMLGKLLITRLSSSSNYPYGLRVRKYEGATLVRDVSMYATKIATNTFQSKRTDGVEAREVESHIIPFGNGAGSENIIIAGQSYLFGSSSYHRHYTETVKRNGTLVAKRVSRFPFNTAGEFTLDVVDHYDSGSSDTVTTQYVNNYLASTTEPGKFGKPEIKYLSDGSWEKYTYNDRGAVVRILRPWKGLPVYPSDATLDNCIEEVIAYTQDPYENIPGGAPEGIDIATADHILYKQTKILGSLVGLTQYVYSVDTENGEPVVKTTIKERMLDPNMDRISSTRTYHASASGSLRDKIIDETTSGGVKTTHSYAMGDWNAGTATFTMNMGGRYMQHTTTEGTVANPEGIAMKSKRYIVVQDVGMKPVCEKQQVYDGSAYVTVSTTLYNYDALGRLETKTRDGRIIEERSYNGLVTTTTDEYGIVRTITNDLNGRIVSDAKTDGPTTTYTYNGKTTTTNIGGATATKTVDLLGRAKTMTAVDGSVTSYDYPNDGRDTRVTKPGNIKVLRTNYPGGLEQSVTNNSGSSITNTYFTHGINADGSQWTEVRYGSTNSPRWEKITKNMLGEVLLRETPAPSGTGTVTVTSSYNDHGLLEKTSYSANAGLADRIYEYSALGKLYREGIDVDGGGLDPASNDNITEYDYGNLLDNGVWYGTRTIAEYKTDGSGIATTVQTVKSRHSANVSGTAGEVITTDASGVETIAVENIDRATKTRTLTTSSSNLTGSNVRTFINGLLKSEMNSWDDTAKTWDYDSQERLEVETNARTGATTTRAYNSLNQLESITDGGNNVTSFYYYPSNHKSYGRIKEVRNAQSKSTYSEYNDRGDLTREWGSATTPVERFYDSYGQLETLKTYRGGSGWDTATWSSSPGTADTTTWRYYEATGLLKEKEDAATRKTSYTWRDSGLMHTREWERGTVTTYSYDTRGLETGVAYSMEPVGVDTPDVVLTRDRTGKVNTVTDAAGTSTLAYTNADQLDTVTYGGTGVLPGYTLDYGFDAHGRRNDFSITRASNTLYQTGLSYDPVTGRISTLSQGGHSAEYLRMRNSSKIRQLTMKKDGESILVNARGYDQLDRLSYTAHYITASGGLTNVGHETLKYDSLYRKEKSTYENGENWNYSYNDRNELESANKKLADTTLLEGHQFIYGYDNAGNRTSKQTGGDSTGVNLRTYTTPANNLNQYASYATPGSIDILGKAPSSSTITVNGQSTTRQGDTFRYNLSATNTSGAWVSVAVSDGTQTVNGYRYIAPASFTPVYDLDGNLTDDGEWFYKYDGENRLIEVQRSTAAQAVGAPYHRIEYTYDSRHRRIQALHYSGSSSPPVKTEKFLYDEWNRCLSTDENDSAVQSFVWGLDAFGGLHRAGGGTGGLLWINDHALGETHLACTDSNSSISRLIESSTKAVTAHYEYSPFGELLRITGSYATSNPYRYSSKPQDNETGLYDYGMRSYKPEWGVWLGRDPLGEMGGVNLYGFVSNNPLNGIDYLGGEFLGYNSWGEYWGEVGDNLGNFGEGIYLGGKEAIEGIRDLPEVAKFLASPEFREMIDKLINDPQFRKDMLQHLGEEFCDYFRNLGDPEFFFKEGGKVAFGVITGAGMMKVIGAFKKVKNARRAMKIAKELDKSPLNEVTDVPVRSITRHVNELDPRRATSNSGSAIELDVDTNFGGVKKVDYSGIKDPPDAGPGKDFTARQKREGVELNRQTNDGNVRSDESGTILSKPQKSLKGVTPDPNEWQFDHIIPKDKGGTNKSSNMQILSRRENRAKSNK